MNETPAALDGVADPDTRPLSVVGESLADRIRRRHLGARTKDLAVPRYQGDIVARFKVLPTRELLRVGRGKTALISNADLLVAACQEVLFLDEDGSLHPAAEDDGGPGPVRFDGRLADLMQLAADTPRDVVLRLYAEDAAIHGHADVLMAWMTGKDLDTVSAEEVEDLAGEVPAAT